MSKCWVAHNARSVRLQASTCQAFAVDGTPPHSDLLPLCHRSHNLFEKALYLASQSEHALAKILETRFAIDIDLYPQEMTSMDNFSIWKALMASKHQWPKHETPLI